MVSWDPRKYKGCGFLADYSADQNSGLIHGILHTWKGLLSTKSTKNPIFASMTVVSFAAMQCQSFKNEIILLPFFRSLQTACSSTKAVKKAVKIFLIANHFFCCAHSKRRGVGGESPFKLVTEGGG